MIVSLTVEALTLFMQTYNALNPGMGMRRMQQKAPGMDLLSSQEIDLGGL